MSQTQLSPANSINGDDSSKKAEKTKSRRPPNSAFRQQRLKAWQPILTPKTVLPLLFVTGVIFAPLGGLLLYASAQVQEIIIDYTDCDRQAPTTFDSMPSGRVSSSFTQPYKIPNRFVPSWQRSQGNVSFSHNTAIPATSVPFCSVQFQIPNDIHPPIFLYYRLSKFYQNHRRYVKSLDQDQLQGKTPDVSTVNGSDCDPLTSEWDPVDGRVKPLYPCGLIANSMFNDTYRNPRLLNAVGSDANSSVYPMTSDGVAWSTDKQIYQKTGYANSDVIPPPNWRVRYPTYNDDYPIPDLSMDEPFQVWMRTAGLPTFSKLALRNENDTMLAGTYQIDIMDTFPVSEYGGTKSILISTRTVMGGKNPFLGIAYVVVAGVCILLGTIFLAVHLVKPRKLGDHTYLSWNSDQPSAAAATGRQIRSNEAA